jgi:hypothetical protein
MIRKNKSKEQLIKDLQDMIGLYEKYVEGIQTKKPSLENSEENDFDFMDNKKKLFEINEYIKNHGYQYSQELINNFYLSLKQDRASPHYGDCHLSNFLKK